MTLHNILKEVITRATIGYPPTDHRDEKRTIKEAIAKIKVLKQWKD
jgi:hypothetical protein